MAVRVVLLGFGNVNQALARLLLAKERDLESGFGLRVRVVGIATQSRGTVADCNGLDLEACLAAATLNGLGTALPDADALLEHVQGSCDAVLEAVNCGADGGPALRLLRRALQLEPPAHAITASKPPVALAYTSLTELASQRDRRFLFESSVMDGVPIFSLLRQLPGARVTRLVGVLNSTSNLVLTRMRREGCSLWDAVKFAQEQGIAERDPSDDLDGKDAAVKLGVLCAVAFRCPVHPAHIKADSIREVSLEQVRGAAERGCALKVVCEAVRSEGTSITASVTLKELPWEHPLASLDGASSALTFETDVMAPVTVTSTDPTTTDTAYGLLQDLLTATLGDGRGLS
ncbi:unnamed protein product [Effrenium voratum]|nr:unnamed protein product [Effrenium voratum]